MKSESQSSLHSFRAPLVSSPSIPSLTLDSVVDVAVELVWTHPASCADQDLELLRKLSEFQFAIDSFIDSQACGICSAFDFACPNSL